MTINDRILDLAIQIQQIPAPTFNEGRRAVFIRNQFEAEKLTDIQVDSLGNVTARLRGSGFSPPVVVTAHSDTVFPIDTDLSISRKGDKIYGPGIGDNSLGVAGLFGLLWHLQERTTILPGDLWLVSNVCEEGLGDLKGMRAVIDRFKDQPLAYIVVEGMALGQIYHRGLGVQRYRISATTEGGHSWVDFGKPSAIHELANDPHPHGSKKLSGRPAWRIRVGAYRVIYEIFADRLLILVVAIGHRKEVYR